MSDNDFQDDENHQIDNVCEKNGNYETGNVDADNTQFGECSSLCGHSESRQHTSVATTVTEDMNVQGGPKVPNN